MTHFPFHEHSKTACLHVYPSELGRSLQSTAKSAEVDGQRLQGLIDGNKRWLEMRKKDTSVYPSVRKTHPHTHTYCTNHYHDTDMLVYI